MTSACAICGSPKVCTRLGIAPHVRAEDFLDPDDVVGLWPAGVAELTHQLSPGLEAVGVDYLCAPCWYWADHRLQEGHHGGLNIPPCCWPDPVKAEENRKRWQMHSSPVPHR